MNLSDEIVKAAANGLRSIRTEPGTPRHITMTVHIKVAWWLRPYLYVLACFCWLHGTEPNPEKLRRALAKGITVKKA